MGKVDELFISSLDNLWHELQRIAAAVTGMTESGRSLTPPTSPEQTSLFLTIEHSLHGVLHTAASLDAVDAAVSIAVAELQAVLAEMQLASQEISRVGHQLIRVSLNANIRSAQLGEPGRPLGVLAVALQNVGENLGSRCERIASAVEEMSGAAHRLAVLPDASHGTVIDRIPSAITGLHDIQTASPTHFVEVTGLAPKLLADIEKANECFHAGTLFTHVITDCQASLKNMAAGSAGWTEELELPEEGPGAEIP